MSTTDAILSLYNESIPFEKVYKNYNLHTLPSWVRNNISEARVYGTQNRCIILPDGRKYHMDNPLNDMCGRDWTIFINSVFSTCYPTRGKESYAHEIRKIHPSPKPPQLMKELIEFFTKENELVFDSFMGVGGTLLGAALCNRRAVGIEINSTYIDAYKKAAKSLQLPLYNTFQGDCLEIIASTSKMTKLIKDDEISLMLIDPPYSNMMSRKKTGGDISVYGKTSTPFSDDERDLGNMSKEEFLLALQNSVKLTLPYIKFRGYVLVFIKDLQPNKKEINMLHAEVASILNEIPELNYKGMKIWADKSTKPYPYGYPFSFVANQIHQYILIFRKEK